MNHCKPETPFPLYGRGGNNDETAVRDVQLFGQWADGAGAVNAPAQLAGGQLWSNENPPNDPRDKEFNGGRPASQRRERLWLVETHVQSVVAQGEAVPVLARPAIASGFNSRRGLAQVQITLANQAGGGTVLLDAGQSLEVYAIGVNASVFAAQNYVEVLPTNIAGLGPLAGIVENVLLSLAILPIEESRGRTAGQFSQWVNIAAGVTQVFPVPPFARKLRIRQSAAGVAAPNFFLAASPAALVQAQVPIGATRQSENVEVGNAIQVRSNVDAVSARLFELVWTIET